MELGIEAASEEPPRRAPALDDASAPLADVVALADCAKRLRRYAFEVGLSALGAIVRSSRSGDHLLGFKEVASQMRHWSADLALGVRELSVRTMGTVRLESELLRGARLARLLEAARVGARSEAAIGAACARHQESLANLRVGLRRSRRELAEQLEQLMQLGMMASVLSRAALIEAGSAADHERHELSIASQEFASYADRVNEVVTDAVRRNAWSLR